MGPTGSETKNVCAGEDQQQFTGLDDNAGFVRLPESWDSKIWTLVQRDSDPRMAVLVRTRSILLDPTNTSAVSPPLGGGDDQ
jgi:hypothetical protein